MNSRLAVFFLVLLTALAGCKRPSRVTTAGPLDTTSLGLPLAPNLDFTYLSSRARFSYRGEEQNLNASATIRIERNRALWVSVSPGLGIEVLRCLITPDSVFAVDRYNRKNYRYDYATLSKKLDFQITYPILEAALLGNLPYPELAPSKLTLQETFYLLTQRVGNLTVENYVGDTNGKLARVIAEEDGTQNLMEVNYGEYEPLANGLFPYESRVTLTTFETNSTAKTEIDVRHQNVEVRDQSPGFPFEFPDAYQMVVD